MMNLSAPRESRGQLYNSPQISHRIERSIKNKKNKTNDRVHFNYLGSDVLLSTIYRPLKLMQKYINCLDVQKLFHSTTMYILYMVNNWFFSFN